MRKKIDINKWNRAEHFRFFYAFDEPFFGVTSDVDITKAKAYSKKKGISFFNYYLHKVSVAINLIENFRYRIIDKEVYLYDRIDVSNTFLRDDHTFSFSNIEYNNDFNTFSNAIESEKSRIQKTTGIGIDDERINEHSIHVSTLPWFSFKSLSHARNFKIEDSATKITFGKYYQKEDRYFLPISIHSHHGLVDGYHVGQFFTQLHILLDYNYII